MTTSRTQGGQDLDLDAMPPQGHAPVPVGFWLLFGGLIAFGGYYFYAYTPWLSGWTQYSEHTRPGAAAAQGDGVSIAATIAFTALAALAAGAILLGLSRRRRAP